MPERLRIPNPLRFIGAVARAFRRLLHGESPLATRFETRMRRLYCRGGHSVVFHRCPHYNRRWDQCDCCACSVTLKTLLADETCPMGKW